MPGAGDENGVQIVRFDRAVDVRVDEVETGRRAPVAEQPRLDVLGAQRLAQQGVVEQVDLTDGEIVRGAPPRVEQIELACGERTGGGPRFLRLGAQGRGRIGVEIAWQTRAHVTGPTAAGAALASRLRRSRGCP